MWKHAIDVWRGRAVVGGSPGVGRVFFLCRECRRVVPAWRLVRAHLDGPIGCRCGGAEFYAKNISEWRAAAWVIGSWLWRRVLCRKVEDWDPRVADRTRRP